MTTKICASIPTYPSEVQFPKELRHKAIDDGLDRGHPVVRIPALTVRESDLDGKKSALDLAIKSLFVLWFIAVAMNLAVWLGVCLTVGRIYYFWPMWVILPGIIFPAIRWLREYL